MKKEGNEVASVQLHKLAEDLSLTVDELSKAIGLTRRNSCKQTQTLTSSSDKSERILILTKIMAQAVKLHRGKSGAARWMKSPVPALRGRTPLECAATLDGLQEVEAMLTHFNEVVYFRRARAARTSDLLVVGNSWAWLAGPGERQSTVKWVEKLMLVL